MSKDLRLKAAACVLYDERLSALALALRKLGHGRCQWRRCPLLILISHRQSY